MPIFKCTRCGGVDNTATSNYWNKGEAAPLCSECDPKIGKWHGLFPKMDASRFVEHDGFLWTREELERIRKP